MRTPQELLEQADKTMKRCRQTKWDYLQGYRLHPAADRSAFADEAQGYVALAMALMQLEQTNFIETLAKGLDS